MTNVYRIVAISENGEFYLELDVHTSLYSMLSGEKWANKTLADEFEFVMHELRYRMPKAAILKCRSSSHFLFIPDSFKTATIWRLIFFFDRVVYISFGGLQLMLRGDLLKMHQFSSRKPFLLLRKM
ncbi:DNA-directed RNA polymerases II and V subunit 8A-like [Primulina tabacum]|uniref:DNA-directed RNA polymerases II and V subunit 8A-like n=1 Tax=Primulina tabacum TaxID=48773 RepID=UPI003F59F135